MRLGVNFTPPHSSPGEWGEKIASLGLATVVFPCDENASDAKIDAYLRICEERGFTVAEVGAWTNPLSPDPDEAARATELCKRRLAFADRVGARCCVCTAGMRRGRELAGPLVGDFSRHAVEIVAESVRGIIDAVKPARTYYTLEPVAWMMPSTPEQYLELIETVDRERFAVHMDLVNMLTSPERFYGNAAFAEKCFELLAGRIRACHVKDAKLGAGAVFHVQEAVCGDGIVDLRRYADLATAEDPDMPFLVEHLNDWDAYVESTERLKRILK